MSFIIGVPIARRKRSRTAREIAEVVHLLQEAAAHREHADRDGCWSCAVESTMLRKALEPTLPARYRNDLSWMFQHIVMPGTRLLARWEAANG